MHKQYRENLSPFYLDLREDRRYANEQMGYDVITSSQVCFPQFLLIFSFPMWSVMFLEGEAQLCELNINKQGEELRKQIGASAYIECSAKTQQVDNTT